MSRVAQRITDVGVECLAGAPAPTSEGARVALPRMRVLAIDQGTSATKAVVVADGHVVGEAESTCEPTATTNGGVQVDPELLWRSVVDAATRAIELAGGELPDAIGLANQGETIVAWDRATGRPIGDAIVWQDRRSASLCERLRSDGWAPRLAQITGLELDPYFVAPKVAWLRDQVGDGPAITTSDVWLLNRMCATFVTDVSTAGRTLLLDLDSATWSDEACAAFGIDPADLPTVVGNAQPVGETTMFADRPIPVTGLCVDQQAALFAESCTEAGEAKCTYGTGAFLLACTGSKPVRSGSGLVGCVAWQIDGETTWCLDGQVFTVGAAVRWLQEIGVITGPADLDALGSTVTDSGGVTFIPALAGLGAPFWAPAARGSLTGLSLATTKAHLVRAVVDGIAAQVALLAQAIGDDLGGPLQTLRVDGGLTRSTLVLQTQADLAQIPIEVYPSTNATALGVAAMAMIGHGARAGLPSWNPTRVVTPRISADEAEGRLGRWRAIAEHGLRLDG